MAAAHATYDVVTRDGAGRIAAHQVRAATAAEAQAQSARGGLARMRH